MTNIHTPERQPNESFEQYRARQARSRAINKTMRKGPTQAPAVNALDVSRFFLGQHTNPKRNAERRLVKALGGIRSAKTMKRRERTLAQRCGA